MSDIVGVGLTPDELDELLAIHVEIDPQSIELHMEFDGKASMTVSFTCTVTFRSLTNIQKDCFVDQDGLGLTKISKQQGFIDEFDECHIMPLPTMELNCRPPSEERTHSIEKLNLPEEMQLKLKDLEIKAYNHLEKDDERYKLETFEATQSYTFEKIPLPNWAAATNNFPLDVHHVRFSFAVNPIDVYQDDSNALYELIIPDGRKSKGNLRPHEGVFHPNIRVSKFPFDTHTKVHESILEFEIEPGSMKIYETAPREISTKNTNFRITFTLVRHVLGPALTTLVPIYVIAFLTPFVFFFDLSGKFDDIAAYLVTLLLALVAHRIAIADAQKETSIQNFTMADFDFAFCLFIIVFQMIVFAIVTNSGNLETTAPKTRFPTPAPVQTQTLTPTLAPTSAPTSPPTGPESWSEPIEALFGLEVNLIVWWILYRVLAIITVYRKVPHLKKLDLTSGNAISIDDYRQLKVDREYMEKEIGEPVFLKSLFSINMRILRRQIEMSTQHSKVKMALPTNDVFRFRLHMTENEIEKAVSVLAMIQGIDRFQLEYNKTIDKGAAAKSVYKYTPIQGGHVFLEVQFLKNKEFFSPKEHEKYKLQQMKEMVEMLQRTDISFNKSDLVKMYGKSLWVEIVSRYKHNFWNKCAFDWKLLWLTWRLLGAEKRKASKVPDEKRKVSKEEDARKHIEELGLDLLPLKKTA